MLAHLLQMQLKIVTFPSTYAALLCLLTVLFVSVIGHVIHTAKFSFGSAHEGTQNNSFSTSDGESKASNMGKVSYAIKWP